MFRRILLYFFTWRLFLFFVAFLSIYFVPKFTNSFPYVDRVLTVTKLPSWVWSFGGFDGVHYLRIAQNGYEANFTQAFFPVYPLLIRLTNFLPASNLDRSIFVDPSFFITGLVLSNVLFVFALYFFYKIVEIDFDNKIAYLSTILLLVFPTSFFFGSVYTESLFLLLTTSSIYFMRKNKFLLSALLISVAGATRVIGGFLIPLYFLEAYKSKNKWNYLYGLLTPLGIIAYMYYLNVNFNDPFYFFTSQASLNTGRDSEGLIMLPQVIYRYLKIFVYNNPLTVSYFISFLEMLFTLLPLGLFAVYFKKIHFGYLVFGVASLLVGTLTGTLSSVPRYSIFAFVFLMPLIIKHHFKYFKYIVAISVVLLVILTMLFVRGYFVS